MATTTSPSHATAGPARRGSVLRGLDWRRYIIYIGFVMVFLVFAITLNDDGFLNIQVRAVDNGAPATQRMSLMSIDPAVSTNDAVIATGAATGSPAAPKVVTRAQLITPESEQARLLTLV